MTLRWRKYRLLICWAPIYEAWSWLSFAHFQLLSHNIYVKLSCPQCLCYYHPFLPRGLVGYADMLEGSGMGLLIIISTAYVSFFSGRRLALDGDSISWILVISVGATQGQQNAGRLTEGVCCLDCFWREKGEQISCSQSRISFTEASSWDFRKEAGVIW